MLEKLKRRNNNKGFTLIELSIVIVIILLLVLIAVPKVARMKDQAKIASDRASIETMNRCITMHCAVNSYENLVGQTSMNVAQPIKNNDSVTVIVQFLKDKGLLTDSATIYFPIAHQYNSTDNKVN
jgi:type IV pilus assembly protein PilA